MTIGGEGTGEAREPSMMPPPYLLEIALEARAADAERLRSALTTLVGRSQTAAAGRTPGQVLLRGMDEVEMERVVDRLRKEFKLYFSVGAPQVVCRETISRPAEAYYKYRSASGWQAVQLCVEPLAAEAGLVLEMRWSEVAQYSWSPEQAAAVAKGVTGALECGVLGGFQVVDLKVIWTSDPDDPPVEEMAVRGAMQTALAEAAPRLLEPVMRVEVVTPKDCMAEVIGDLQTRGGRLTEQRQVSDGEAITALVPLAKLLGYARSLAALSPQRASVVMEFSHYQPGPPYDGGDAPFRTAMAMRA